MPTNKKCFIDLDGVLVDLMGGLSKKFGFEDPYVNEENLGNPDFSSLIGTTDKEIFTQCDEDFWASLDPLPEYLDLINLCLRWFGQENISILTSNSYHSKGCCDGKLAWVNKHVPMFSRQILQGKNKYICADPNALLIDDLDYNVNKFRDRNGQAFLIPRPWNSNWHKAGNDYFSDLRRHLIRWNYKV